MARVAVASPSDRWHAVGMRASVCLLSSCLVLTVSFGLARRAEACSPPLAGLSGSYPAKGVTTYPANAPIVLQGYGLDTAAGLSATVAGKPATLSHLIDVRQNRLGLVLGLSPQPVEGDAVTVKGNACGPDADTPSCQVDLSFQAGPNDASPPDVPASISYDVHDYLDFDASPGDCQSSSDLAVWVSLPATPAAVPGEFWIVDVRKAGETASLQETLAGRSATGTGSTVALRLSAQTAGDATKGGLCVGVRSFDIAGNESSRVESCTPCRVRIDPQTGSGGNGSFSPPPKPEWTAVDTFPGGSCGGPTNGGSGGNGAGGSGAAGGSNAAGGQTSSAGAAGAVSSGGSAGTSSGLAPVTPSGDDGGCSLGPRSPDTRRGVTLGALLVGALGLLLGLRRRVGRAT